MFSQVSQEIFNATTSKELLAQIEAFNPHHVIVSVSGGKDSTALALWAKKFLPIEKLTLVHAKIDIDWKETESLVEQQAQMLGLPLKMVCAVDKDGNEKGFIDQLTAKRVNRKTGEVGEYQFPSSANRWCTSVLKTGPIDKYARSLSGRILVLIGERREESSNRAKLEAWRPDATNSIKGRKIVKCSPILDIVEKDIWTLNNLSGVPVHPCYTKYGVSRASCAICIFSSDKDILQAAKYAPEVVQKLIDAEKKISHTYRYKAPTKKKGAVKETIAEIVERMALETGNEQILETIAL